MLNMCITRSSLSWYFRSWMHKTLTSTTTMSGFMFITIPTVVSCRVDKVFVLNKLGLGVVPNNYFSSSRSLLPLSLKVFTIFLSACYLSIRIHPYSIIHLIVPNTLTVISSVFNNNVFNSSIGSWYSWSTFGELVCIYYWVPSFVDLFTSSTSVWATTITTLSSIGWSTWYVASELKDWAKTSPSIL